MVVNTNFKGNSGTKVIFYVVDQIISLFNVIMEELYALPIFIAVAMLLKYYMHLSRSKIIYRSLFVSILMSGLVHFETYDWHLVQMFLVVGVARAFITGAYIKLKNIWVAYAIHFLTDFIIGTAILMGFN